MKSTTTTALIAAGALLVGGAATAAFMSHRSAPGAGIEGGIPTDSAALQDGRSDALPQFAYADIVKVDPVTEKSKLYATVIGTEPVREVTTTSTPREVCNDVVVQERLPERDGNVGGTVAGALIGGLVGNQFGSGNGRKAATVAGAAAGGYVGNRVDRNHVGGRVVNRTERQCHTENTASESSRVTGYNVTYRNEDGTTGTMRMSDKPGNRIAMGNTDEVVGYDVTYRLDGQEKVIRMDDKPQSDRLPVVDGKVVVQAQDGTMRS
ncbi:glycine zipper 2TM domain-containing protein [Pseudoxanthomonas composti]|uniref:Glycine zipper 2TM domain-containing protein n=1 Tax=Pseudoxanthomonas composti TaxID=2137479 RepID=A0A4V1N1B1_9GAMM|nr:glycine zipper 2TM domain-containing protein [Pseudoxanthomonas composti]RXR07029.1 glycine zipper 2TM domain-containing protein [Pseudoxanthomonas composti]